MDIIRAKEILEGLADGVNPMTGEVLPMEDSCNQADVIRALHTILAALSEKKLKPQPENAGKPWTSEDDNVLARMFDAGKSRKEICEFFKRSTGAITSRLARLGRSFDGNHFQEKD